MGQQIDIFEETEVKIMTNLNCDTCGESIQELNDGWVEWLSQGIKMKPVLGTLRIVHHIWETQENAGCQYRSNSWIVRENSLHDTGLKYFSTNEGKKEILSLIEQKSIAQKDGFELLRRLWDAGL